MSPVSQLLLLCVMRDTIHHDQIHREDLPSSGASGYAEGCFRAAAANTFIIPYNRACPLEVSPHFCFAWIRPVIMGCMHLMCFARLAFPHSDHIHAISLIILYYHSYIHPLPYAAPPPPIGDYASLYYCTLVLHESHLTLLIGTTALSGFALPACRDVGHKTNTTCLHQGLRALRRRKISTPPPPPILINYHPLQSCMSIRGLPISVLHGSILS